MNIETTNAIKLFFPNPSLVQVLFEALANSLDAGANKVSIRIKIDSYTQPETLQFLISDNGGGFDEESFDRFSQLLKPRDKEHKGLGRLVYLKYFNTVEVVSRWGNHQRTFTFADGFNGESELISQEEEQQAETLLKFSGFSGERIKSYDDIKPGCLKEKIIEQFLPTFYDWKRKERNFDIRIELETKEDRNEKDFFSSDEAITPDDLPLLKAIQISDPTLDAFEGIEMLYRITSGMGQQRILTAANIDGRTIPIPLLKPSALPVDHSVLCLFFSKLFQGSTDSARQTLVLPETITESDLRRVLRRELSKVLSENIEQIGTRNDETSVLSLN